MSNISKLLFCASLVILCSCSKTNETTQVIESSKVTFSAKTQATRTHFGEKNGDAYPTLWDEVDNIYACVNCVNPYALSTSTLVTAEGANAQFEVELPSIEAPSYTFYAYSPKDSYSAETPVNTGGVYETLNYGEAVRFWIPTVQIPTANSVDSHSQILFGHSIEYPTFETSPELQFSHITAYGKLSMTNLNIDAEDAIKTVTLIAENNFLSGDFIHFPKTNTLDDSESINKNKSVKIHTNTATNIWFSTFAGISGENDLSNTALTIEVETQKGLVLVRKIDLTDKVLKFRAGRVSSFGVDMATATPKPIVTVSEMNYAYRIANVTPTTATITCRVIAGLDASVTASTCKVMWGTSPESLTNELSPESVAGDGSFSVALTGLTQSTTYYFLPKVSNAAGTSDDSKVNSFRTPVSAKEYLFDESIENNYLLNRMSNELPECADLVYYELDPIVNGNKTFYLLDRNLNARAPFEKSDITTTLSSSTVDLWKKVGGLYMWGYTTPSYTWNVPAFTDLTSVSPYNWVAQGALKKPINSQWPVNPCPEGYTIPKKQEYIDMISVCKGDASEGNLELIFDAMRIGPTSAQKANNGNTNENANQAFMHTLDGEVSSKPGQWYIVRIRPDGNNPNFVYDRNNSSAVRCVRVVIQ